MDSLSYIFAVAGVSVIGMTSMPEAKGLFTGAEIGDVDRMARYAVDLLTNDVKRHMFGEACRRRAVDHFDVHPIVDLYESYYAECLAADPIPVRVPQS